MDAISFYQTLGCLLVLCYIRVCDIIQVHKSVKMFLRGRIRRRILKDVTGDVLSICRYTYRKTINQLLARIHRVIRTTFGLTPRSCRGVHSFRLLADCCPSDARLCAKKQLLSTSIKRNVFPCTDPNIPIRNSNELTTKTLTDRGNFLTAKCTAEKMSLLTILL